LRKEASSDFPEGFLGGMGFATWILYTEMRHADPMTPENKPVIAPGLLTTTGIPTASRTAFISRSPLTGATERIWEAYKRQREFSLYIIVMRMKK